MTAQQISDEYTSKIKAHFESRWRSVSGKNLSEAQFDALIQEIVLDWVHFYRRYERTAARLFHTIGPPSVTSYVYSPVIIRHVQMALGEEDNLLVSHLMGLSPEEYNLWRRGYDLWVNR